MQSRIASMVGFMADLITCYRSTHWGGLWGVQHLLMFYCFWPPVCPWVNQNCRVICSLSISWWDHNVSITFVVAGGPASTRSQLWAIFSPLYPTGEQNVLTMPQKWHMLQQPLRENTCPGKQYCCEWETGRDVERFQHVWQAVNGNKCSTEGARKTETQTLTEWMNLSLTPAVSTVPAGGTDYKTTAKSSSTDNDRGHVSTERNTFSDPFIKFKQAQWPLWTQQINNGGLQKALLKTIRLIKKQLSSSCAGSRRAISNPM